MLAGPRTSVTRSYSQRSLWLEQCVLDGLRSIRIALDTLPFTAREGNDTIARTEEKLWALWLQLFVVAFGYNHLLITRMQLPLLATRQPSIRGWYEYYLWTEQMLSEMRTHGVSKMLRLVRPNGFWRLRWKAWCELRQFYYFAGDPCGLVKRHRDLSQCGVLVKLFGGHGSNSGVSARLSGALVVDDLVKIETELLNKDEVHRKLWKQRREEYSNRTATR